MAWVRDRLPGRRRNGVRADRLTVGLAGVAAATAGTVLVGELLRLTRRRIGSEEPSPTMLASAEHAIVAARHATQDTMAVAIEGYEATTRQEVVLFNLLAGFVLGFASMRLSTTGIRGGWWPAANVRIGDKHIHHFIPGIVIAFGSGAAGLVTKSEELEKALAFPFGAGVGLTLDEAALLLDLRDVYWTREGVLSVQLSLGFSALLGATILALRMLRRGERGVEQAGLIPLPDPVILETPVASK